MVKKEIVLTDKAPGVIGPYSQAVKVSGLVFTCGVIAVDPATETVVSGGISEQTTQVMENLKTLLQASGASMRSAVKTTCYLADLKDFETFNSIYAMYFDVEPPARASVQVARLPRNVLLEVECVAALEDEG